MQDFSAWIGRSTEAEDELTERRCQEFTATFEDLLFPVAPGHAPLGMHWCLSDSPMPTSKLSEDGLAAEDGFRPPIPLPMRMAAGSDLHFTGSLPRAGTVRRVTSIADIQTKQGRSGPLVFLTLEHAYLADGSPALREVQRVVYRGPAPKASADESETRSGRQIARPFAEERTVDRLAIRMFRYSALTSNAHRIHYDADYARDTEGYAGLVVHGPLQATLLLNLAASCGDAIPAAFTYRANAALIASAPFSIRAGSLSDGELTCWTEDSAGNICMEATARWR
ncbi:MAG: protein dehydratase [Rhodobiaceae bacterium]|nr:protein dehydratase [Rhodobiaceae bacterium]MCC0056207.1 protein dehydratase [Rhodobiaceae bacterium]